jgi:hypothetical protein
MQVLRSDPTKILHQMTIANWLNNLMKLSTLVHINKLIVLLFFHNLSRYFFLELNTEIRNDIAHFVITNKELNE